ncbi:hypothetical protein C0J52_12764 [Blattella germanica]|nr:hypothetical protein C0J52_12764 [Blattella germanica]
MDKSDMDERETKLRRNLSKTKMISGKIIRSLAISHNRLIGCLRPNAVFYSQNKQISKQSEKIEESEPKIPRNVLKDVYNATNQKDNGKIYDKKPFKMRLEKGKTYSWCLCGQSKSQVLCS